MDGFAVSESRQLPTLQALFDKECVPISKECDPIIKIAFA
jgi:hypothetical protein